VVKKKHGKMSNHQILTQERDYKMLVLSRKVNERIIIDVGDVEIIVCVCKMTRNRARIGIEAPLSVRIQREEIHNKEKK